jgi:hypothetical protein
MKKTYRVAGHKFAVVMPDNDAAWNEMGPYEPFVCEDASDCLFTAELLDAMPDTSDKQKVTVSCEGPDMPRIELYEWRGQWLMEMAPLLEAPVRAFLLTDKTFHEAKFRILGSIRFSLGTSLMLMFAFATARKNTLLMHSSVTVKDGKGYLFLGKSGTGKSTHSSLWLKYVKGAQLVNDDNPVVRRLPDGFYVFGSPWSGKTPCYRNVRYPLGGVVQLSQAPYNKIHRLNPLAAYAALVPSISGKRWAKLVAEGLHETENMMAGEIDIWHLECLPDEAAALLCSETIRTV